MPGVSPTPSCADCIIPIGSGSVSNLGLPDDAETADKPTIQNEALSDGICLMQTLLSD